MPKFMMIYKGEATDMADMTEEQAAGVMAKWATWMEKVGLAITDIGTPFGPGASVVDDGSAGTAATLTGYSIVEAAGLDAATTLAHGHPYLSEGKSNYAVDIFELMPVPFDERSRAQCGRSSKHRGVALSRLTRCQPPSSTAPASSRTCAPTHRPSCRASAASWPSPVPQRPASRRWPRRSIAS